MQSAHVKKTGVKPVYSAYTDDDGKFEGKMYVPASLKEAYLYTDAWGLPQCVKMELTGEGAVYDATCLNKELAPTIRKSDGFFNMFPGNPPYKVKTSDGLRERDDNMYSLCKWDANGGVEGIGDDYTPGYLSMNQEINGDNVGAIASRVSAFFRSYSDVGKGKELLRNADVTNIRIPAGGSVLDVMYLMEQAQYENSFGYYYYRADNAPKTESDFKNLKKYILFPNVSTDLLPNLKRGSTARLKYFGPDGNSEGVDMFPEGYVVGWFFVSQGFYYPSIRNCDYDQYRNNIFFTNDEGNKRRFVSAVDQKTGTVVVGYEDQPVLNDSEDFCDALFYIKSSADLNSNDKPEVPDDKPELKLETIEGTLAFEDIWPDGGDYDLNDVVMEYKRVITYDKDNYAIQIEETFTPVNNGADYTDFFAYQVQNMGAISALPEECIFEKENNSIVINSGIKNILGKPFVIKRTFAEKTVQKDVLKEDFNPYIIVGEYSTSKRVEVHLPKHAATGYADEKLNYEKEDAYYINKNGKYPFGINIPVTGFVPAKEKQRIDDSAAYPDFGKWVESNGTMYTDWYKNYKGKK